MDLQIRHFAPGLVQPGCFARIQNVQKRKPKQLILGVAKHLTWRRIYVDITTLGIGHEQAIAQSLENVSDLN